MEQLPSELFAKIFQSLSDNDILNLPSHIISHTLTDAKAQKLLQTIEILLERNSLERLNRISRHPNLARHIKEIRFYSPEAFPASFWDTYHGNGHPKAPKETSSYNHTKLASEQLRGKCSVRAKFTRYRMQLEEQKRMEKQQEDVLLLRIIFGHLFNLETISIDNMNKVGLRDDLNNACCYIVKEDPLEYCGSHLLEVLLKVMSTSTKKISSLKVMNDARPAWYGNGMDTMNFPAMFTKLPPNTIFSAVQELRSLKLKRVRYGIDEIQFRDAVREESCGYYWSHNACEGMKHGTTEAITEMLSSAPLLEDLTLTFYKDDRAYREPLLMPYIPLESIRGSNELQHLKRLSLANFKIRQDHLVPFLLCVAGTLTHVDMDGVVLESGSWFSAFSRLRGKFPQLEKFKIGFGDLYEARLELDKKGTEKLGCTVNATDVSVFGFNIDQIIGFGDDELLGWFRDGTGPIPIVRPSQRCGPFGDSDEFHSLF